MKKQACKKCKLITDEELCPNCKHNSFAQSIQGRIHFIDYKKSRVAHEMDINYNGEYAIKIR